MLVGLTGVLVGSAGVAGGCGVLVDSAGGSVVGCVGVVVSVVVVCCGALVELVVAGVVAGADVGVVAGVVAGVDVGVVAGVDVEMVAEVDAGVEAEVDAGVEAGGIVDRLVLVLGGTADELAEDDAELAEDDAEGFAGALEEGVVGAGELRPGTVMVGETGADGAELLETADGSALGSGTADVEVPQPLSTTARARTGIRAAGTTRTRMGPRVPALRGRTVSKPRVSAGSPTVEGESLPPGGPDGSQSDAARNARPGPDRPQGPADG